LTDAACFDQLLDLIGVDALRAPDLDNETAVDRGALKRLDRHPKVRGSLVDCP
jgi:hypothetical protein